MPAARPPAADVTGHAPSSGAGLVLEPFRATFFDPARVEHGAVICPPYDVVEPAEDAALRRRSPYNAVHLVRPQASPDVGKPGDAYGYAAQLMTRWRCDGVLQRDGSNALYVYEQVVEGRRLLGLVGAVGVRDDAERVVLPHEEVFAGPVADRLALMEATDAQLEPILLVQVGGSGFEEIMAAASGGPAWLDALPPDGSRHRVWRLTDPPDLARIAATLVGTQALIADGHHRYATYQRLQHERRASGRGSGPWDFGLALLVATAPGGLELGAIHRTVRGATMTEALAARDLGLGLEIESLGALDTPAGVAAGTERFPSVAAGPACPPVSAAQLASMTVGPADPTVDSRSTVVLTDGSSAALLRIPPHGADRRSRLTSTLVSEWLLPRVFGCPDESPRVEFHHESAPALAAARAGSGVAVLLPAPDLADVIALASAGQRMPPKSTSFGPKPRSGLVLRLLS